MKKYVIFLSFALVCSVVSFFIPIVNFGMFFSFISICFLFGRSFSEKKQVIKQEKYIYELEHERADSSLLTMGLITGVLIFAGISLKTFFFIWDIISMKNTFQTANLHLTIITFLIIVTPILCGYYWANFIQTVKSLRID